MVEYRLLQRKEYDPKTRRDVWFTLAIAVKHNGKLRVRQWGRVPFTVHKKRLESLTLLDAPKSQWDKPVRWTEIRRLQKPYSLWLLDLMSKPEAIEKEVIGQLVRQLASANVSQRKAA